MGSSSVLKSLGLALTTIIVISMDHTVAKADEVTVAGYTNGCFGAACVPINTSAHKQPTCWGLHLTTPSLAALLQPGSWQ